MSDRLGWTLIHFLWQGAVLGALYAVADSLCRRATAGSRYLLACAALVLMLAAPLATFIGMDEGPAPAMTAPALVHPQRTAAAAAPMPASPAYMPAVVGFWCAGVVILSLWSIGGWIRAQRLKWKSRTPAPEIWRHRLAALAARLRIRRAVRLCESALTEVPTVIGWIRPVILLPVSALSGLAPAQIEALLAHELAHIRRYDYLANLFQTVVETLLFYHPAVWWVSHRIRVEREHCCDDLAVRACGDPLVYARALAGLETLRLGPRPFAMAASGGSLLSRVQRLSGKRSPAARPAYFSLLAPVLGLLTLVAGAGSLESGAAAPPDETAERPAVRSGGFLAGLLDAGYTNLSVDEIISLKQHGVDPAYMKRMRAAGLGVPTPDQLIRLRERGVDPRYAASMREAGIADLDFQQLVPLRENGVDPARIRQIHGLGFGPYNTQEAVELQRNGVGPQTFEALAEAGIRKAAAEEAVRAQQHGLSRDAVRTARKQGFASLSLEQLLKLKRSGLI